MGSRFHNYGSDLNADQRSALKALKHEFSWLTKNPREEWTDQGIRESGEWQEIRLLATHILNTFGWPIETPPSYLHDYIATDPAHFPN